MAAYKTGRERILSLTGSLKGRVRDELLPGPSIRSNSWLATITVDWLSSDPNGQKFTIVASPYSRIIWAYNGLGASDSDTDNTAVVDPITGNRDTVLTGSFSVTVPVEEWVEYTEGAAPTYGGSAVDGDVPGEAVVTFTERTKIGEDAVATMTLNGRTVTATTAISGADVVDGSYQIHIALEGAGGLSAQDCQVYDVAYLVIDTPTYSKANGGVTIYSDGEDTIVTTDGSDTQTGAIVAEWRPPQGVSLAGVLRADANAYTGGGTVRVKRKDGEAYHEITPSLGAYSTDYCQETYSFSGQCDGVTQTTESASEHTKTIYHWLVPPSGEAANQWRLLIRGAHYDAGTITQATTVALDGGFSFGDSGTTRNYAPNKNLSGYRYLLVQTDQAAKDVTLAIGSKEWTVQTSGSGLAIFDLCGPGNLAVDTDARDSRWPIPTDVDTVSGDGCMWGVATIASLTLTAEAGVTCNVASNAVYLSRDTWNTPPGHSFLNVVAPHLYWAPSGTTNTYKRPLLRGDTDGKRSLDEADWTRVVGVPPTHTAETIEGVFDEVNASDSSVVRNVGWSAVIDTDIDVADGAAGDDWMAPDWALMNRNRNASWIEGSGIAYVNGAWRYALDVDVSSAYTLVAQMLCDKVNIYPCCGDVFGLRTGAHRWEYGDDADEARAELRAGRYMRGVVWGLVLHTDGTPFDGATVTYKRTSDGAAGGSGNTDLRGEYLTGLPGALAGETYTAQAETGSEPFPNIQALAYGGLRRRCCFTGVPSSLGCIEADGPRQWLHVGFAKRIRTYNLWGWSILWESADYAIDHWLRLRTDPRRGLLLMLSDDGGGTLGLWVSNDGGNTGTEVDTMTASSAAIEVDSERAAYVLLWEAGGDVQVQISGDGGTTWSAAQNALYLGAAFSGTVVDMARDARRDVLLLALESGGAISIYGSQDLGLTWELVAS